ncbi:unnamed protein product, partial [Linum tenue]
RGHVAIQESGNSILADLHLSQTELAVYLTCTRRAAYGAGSFAAGVAANYVGRRYVLASVGVFYTMGALVVAFTTSYVWFTVGRVMACFGVGMGLLVGPIFIAETTPSTARGAREEALSLTFGVSCSSLLIHLMPIDTPNSLELRSTNFGTSLSAFFSLYHLDHSYCCGHQVQRLPFLLGLNVVPYVAIGLAGIRRQDCDKQSVVECPDGMSSISPLTSQQLSEKGVEGRSQEKTVRLVVGTIAAHVLRLSLFRVSRHLAWRVMAGAATLPTAYFTYRVFSRLFTDTPCWLALRGQGLDAELLMERCGADGAEPHDQRARLERLAGFLTTLNRPLDRQRDRFPRHLTGFWGDVMYYLDSYPRDVFVAAVLYVVLEATYEQIALELVPAVLRQHGLGFRRYFPVAGLVLASVMLVATSISMHAAGRSMARRRGLLLVGLRAAACLLGLLSATTFVDAQDHVGHVGCKTAFAMSCVGMLALEVVIGLGSGPIPWMYGPEVLPLVVRAPSLGFSLLFRFVCSILLVWTFPELYFSFDRAWLGFLVVAGVATLFFLFSFRFVRRTTCRLLMDEPD